MLWSRAYKIWPSGREDLDMTSKYGEDWDLLVHLFIHSSMQQTFGEHPLYERHCMDWWKEVKGKIL